MTVLTIRTDKPEAEIGLFEIDTLQPPPHSAKGAAAHPDSTVRRVAYEKWQAHHQLAETIHLKISNLLSCQGTSLTDLGGIVAYKGPGSFTGLRIGLSIANALAGALGVPIVATNGKDWHAKGLDALKNGKDDKLALPQYGSPARITNPKQ